MSDLVLAIGGVIVFMVVGVPAYLFYVDWCLFSAQREAERERLERVMRRGY